MLELCDPDDANVKANRESANALVDEFNAIYYEGSALLNYVKEEGMGEEGIIVHGVESVINNLVHQMVKTVC